MLVSDFDYDLPPELIAQQPAARGASRLLVVDRARQSWDESTIADLPRWLDAGDLLVANDTRVFPARLIGRREPSGGAVECLLLERVSGSEWDVLMHPGQKLKPGARVVLDNPRSPAVIVRAEVLARRFYGRRRVRFEVDGAPTLDAAVDAIGHVPLPPYIQRPDDSADRDRYQTVFAAARGSIAAPTAGLHFDDRLLASLRAAGIRWATITLHVGYGTFKPVRSETVEEHQVDPERYEIPRETVETIATARAEGRRVVAIGTTTTRALESAVDVNGRVESCSGSTNLFIFPGYRFRVVDAMVTNFHLPRSSLLMLVAAFAGRELILAAYRHAVEQRFRFYSYGDVMLIL